MANRILFYTERPAIAGTFIIVLGGAVLEVLLEKVRHGIGSVITA